MNAVNAVLSCKAGWGQYFMFLYTLKLLSMWSFTTKGCQYGASQYFLIKEYSGRVLAGGKLRQFGFCSFAPKNVLQAIIRVDGFHEFGLVKPSAGKALVLPC